MIRVFGMAYRLPFVPAACSHTPQVLQLAYRLQNSATSAALYVAGCVNCSMRLQGLHWCYVGMDAQAQGKA